VAEAVYLVVGEEFLAAEAVERIRSEAGTEELSEVSLDADAEPAEIVTALETPSLLGGRRLVVVERANRLGADQVRAIESYLRSPSPHAVLVLVSPGRSGLEEVVGDRGEIVALVPPRGRALVKWVRERALARELRVDDRACWALIEALGTDLRDLGQGIEQLATAVGAGGHAGVAEVKRMFPRLAELRVWQLTEAFGDRRLPEAMSALRRLLDQEDEPLVILGALAGHLRRLLMAREHAEGGPGAIASAMGLNRWQAERLYRQLRGFREEDLIAGFRILADADLEIKAGDLPPRPALERALVLAIGT
jgi:DNA polymerase III subunit delta